MKVPKLIALPKKSGGQLTSVVHDTTKYEVYLTLRLDGTGQFQI
jgi:hypothetical protein